MSGTFGEMGNLLKQAQQMQRELDRVREELARTRVGPQGEVRQADPLREANADLAAPVREGPDPRILDRGDREVDGHRERDAHPQHEALGRDRIRAGAGHEAREDLDDGQHEDGQAERKWREAQGIGAPTAHPRLANGHGNEQEQVAGQRPLVQHMPGDSARHRGSLPEDRFALGQGLVDALDAFAGAAHISGCERSGVA